MKVIPTIVISLMLITALILQSCHEYSFEKIDLTTAKAWRMAYRKADVNTVRKLYGFEAARRQALGYDTLQLASVSFTVKELASIAGEFKPFFGGKILNFSKVEPPKDQFDGYRIHVGIDSSGDSATAAYILTFGKEILRPDKSSYLQDNLALGIYRINGIKLNFDLFPDEKKTHLSCYPNCQGDDLDN